MRWHWAISGRARLPRLSASAITMQRPAGALRAGGEPELCCERSTKSGDQACARLRACAPAPCRVAAVQPFTTARLSHPPTPVTHSPGGVPGYLPLLLLQLQSAPKMSHKTKLGYRVFGIEFEIPELQIFFRQLVTISETLFREIVPG